ncbi:MAG: septum formation protein Maf [Saprospiraceae bacterium]|nr:septum formation protein Maf [Saprospiraceae bacterium]MCZ2338514.1 Maf family protein [Chitinophagales bacterium]
MIFNSNKKLILGSKSPRRSQLLEEAGFEFEIRVQDIDESYDLDMDVFEVAQDLAIRKADALFETLKDDEVLLTADSVVILNNIIYNKPENYEDGIRILNELSGQTHTVATGVSLSSQYARQSFTSITHVTFDDISNEEIAFYLNTYKPYDKAGGYGIQDWIGLCKVIKIEGSYSNVMGLPIRDVYRALQAFINMIS